MLPYTESVNRASLNVRERIEMTKNTNDLGEILKQQRLMIPLTLRKLAALTGISPSYLGRIEKGERFPSASILQRIAKSLGFAESELLALAGYLSSLPNIEESSYGQVDPCVSSILSREPLEIQRALIAILSILKSIAKTIK